VIQYFKEADGYRMDSSGKRNRVANVKCILGREMVEKEEKIGTRF
jgi:hypothetical protein